MKLTNNLGKIISKASHMYDLKVSDSLCNLGCGCNPLYIYIYIYIYITCSSFANSPVYGGELA